MSDHRPSDDLYYLVTLNLFPYESPLMDQRTTDRVYLSLIVPAFNEEARLKINLQHVLDFLQSQSYSWEVVIVDDGSLDGTAELVRQNFDTCSHVRLFRQPARRGKGAAVRRGMLEAQGDLVFFSDADLSVPIELLPAFLADLQNHADVVIGSRRKAGAKIEIHQPFLRENMGRFFTWLSNRLLGLNHSDLTCGFKGFRLGVARDLFSQQQIENWSFDSEILYLAQVKGYRVSEIPVTWRNDAATKVTLWRDIIASFLGLFQIRLNHYLGRYTCRHHGVTHSGSAR